LTNFGKKGVKMFNIQELKQILFWSDIAEASKEKLSTEETTLQNKIEDLVDELKILLDKP
jgi:hypothetical protein